MVLDIPKSKLTKQCSIFVSWRASISGAKIGEEQNFSEQIKDCKKRKMYILGLLSLNLSPKSIIRL